MRFVCWLQEALGTAACACAGTRVLLARMHGKVVHGPAWGESGLVCPMLVCYAARHLLCMSSLTPV